jgi:hypothetical protein
MNLFRSKVLLIAAGLLLSLSPSLFAQAAEAPQQDKEKSTGPATTMTGCLTKDASGNFMLTDESTGTKTVVTGVSDLEKYSANHKVTLTGTSATDASGKQVFQATKLKHDSNTCKAPSQ